MIAAVETLDPKDLAALLSSKRDTAPPASSKGSKKTRRKKNERPRTAHDHKLAHLAHRRRMHQSDRLHRRTANNADGITGCEHWRPGTTRTRSTLA